MSSCHLLDHVGHDSFAFGALDSELELLNGDHGALPGTLFITAHV
jgi:hypothetical protein